MNINEKKEFVELLNKRLRKSKVVILTNFTGLNVAALTDLRRQLKSVNVEYQVIKNTMLSIASDGTDVALIKNALKGPSAVAISYDDPVTPAKVLTEFAKKYDKFEIKIGVMNGRVLDLASIKALSSLPSREELLARVLATMIAVPTSFVRALNDVPRRIVNVIQAIKEKKENEAL